MWLPVLYFINNLRHPCRSAVALWLTLLVHTFSTQYGVQHHHHQESCRKTYCADVAVFSGL